MTDKKHCSHCNIDVVNMRKHRKTQKHIRNSRSEEVNNLIDFYESSDYCMPVINPHDEYTYDSDDFCKKDCKCQSCKINMVNGWTPDPDDFL